MKELKPNEDEEEGAGPNEEILDKMLDSKSDLGG
jgi:hypothetical protein